MWLGPPCMKSEIMARARGGNRGALGFRSKDCGCRGMLGGVARRFSSRNNHARATLPTPIALRARKRRRDQSPTPTSAVNFTGVVTNNGRSSHERKFKTEISSNYAKHRWPESRKGAGMKHIK